MRQRKREPSPEPERGTIFKDWGGRLPIAIIYPNSYYIGMSSLGLHAIYRLLNSYDDVVCERVFWEKDNRDERIPLLSLESARPLTDFTLLAFSVTYELDYFNIPRILKAAGIPAYARDRDERYPLLLAGGPTVTANPMPLSPFFEALAIGEAEPILPPLLTVLSEGASNREEMLGRLAKLPGIYVPGHTKKPVIRQYTARLDDFPVATVIITDATEFGNMYLIELQRGCIWGCRFCLVFNTFYPARFRSLDVALSQAREGLKHRKRIGLVGPDISDYPHLEELVTRLREMKAEISVSSLRVKPFHPPVLRELVKSGTKTVTLAPETGSPRLCRVIGKGITLDDVYEAVGHTASAGVKGLKLYFMVGLPSETEEDVRGIIDLALSAKKILDSARKGGRLSLNVSPFIPKAGTPFERLPMAKPALLEKRVSLLKTALTPRGIEFKVESPAWSEVQTVLSRGDARLSDVIKDTEEISLANFRRAASRHYLDIDFYAHTLWEKERKLPWDIIDRNTGEKFAL